MERGYTLEYFFDRVALAQGKQPQPNKAPSEAAASRGGCASRTQLALDDFFTGYGNSPQLLPCLFLTETVIPVPVERHAALTQPNPSGQVLTLWFTG